MNIKEIKYNCTTGISENVYYTNEEWAEIELNTPKIEIPVDEEKVAMAEAIIDLNIQIEEIKNKLNGVI
ncbi:hypothetical protein [Clostridium gasigenes]|uniref:Uncharacterized protein n=1 Tax=Clostridium gasigenes TaxID=94869 RepID=A0A7X0SHA4_9CLOT|nr:hypothetical protein [Clostridium gasigenes]MBB6716377.1 hypothetical protein [Clostridium gasigenes]